MKIQFLCLCCVICGCKCLKSSAELVSDFDCVFLHVFVLSFLLSDLIITQKQKFVNCFLLSICTNFVMQICAKFSAFSAWQNRTSCGIIVRQCSGADGQKRLPCVVSTLGFYCLNLVVWRFKATFPQISLFCLLFNFFYCFCNYIVSLVSCFISLFN